MSLDFRNQPFSIQRINRTAKQIGCFAYPKLYFIENLLRIIINSVLSIQIGPNWWFSAASPRLKKRANGVRISYQERQALRPGHALPGDHDIYYVYFSNLIEIIREHAHHFRPVITNIDNLIADVDIAVNGRNLVCHMNYPGEYDRRKVTNLHKKSLLVIEEIRRKGIPIEVPL